MTIEYEPDILAIAIMRAMLYETGAINAREPDSPKRYPIQHVRAIGAAAKTFFDQYPELLHNKAIDDLATGEIDGDDTFAGFGSVPGISQDETRLDTSDNPFWVPLQTALEAFFNTI